MQSKASPHRHFIARIDVGLLAQAFACSLVRTSSWQHRFGTENHNGLDNSLAAGLLRTRIDEPFDTLSSSSENKSFKV